MTGYIYVMTNPSIFGQVKIGCTSKLPSKRASELSSTSLPTSFNVHAFWEVPVNQMLTIEKSIHSHLGKYRTNQSREFFQLDPDDAKSQIELYLGKLDDQAKQHRLYRQGATKRKKAKRLAQSEWKRLAPHYRSRAIQQARHTLNSLIQEATLEPPYGCKSRFKSNLEQQWRQTCAGNYHRYFRELCKKCGHNGDCEHPESKYFDFDLILDTNLEELRSQNFPDPPPGMRGWSDWSLWWNPWFLIPFVAFLLWIFNS